MRKRVSGVVMIMSVLLAAMTVWGAAPARQVRWAGQAWEAPATAVPIGALLTPGLSYWGEVIFAGARLAFDGQELPDDGRFAGWVGGAKPGLLTITFPRPCQVNEITLHLKGEGPLKIEIAGAADPETWETVLERAATADVPMAAKGEYWARVKLPKPVSAVRWRVALPAGIAVKALALWGSGPSVPVVPVGGEVRKKFPVAFESLPGADATTFSDHIYWSWQRPLLADPKFKGLGAVWAQHAKWTRLAGAPILPPADALNQPVQMVMAVNEYEGALLTLTSLKDQAGAPIHDSGIYREFHPDAQEFRLTLGALRGPTPGKVKLTLRVAGTLRTQLWGVVPGPLFSAENKPGAALLMKYLTNGKSIADFPLIALPPCGSQIFGLEAQSDGAAPGVYTTTLTAAPGPSVPVRIEVLPVTLPTPRAWVHSWSSGAVGSTWPCSDVETMAVTVRDKRSRGISSFNIPLGYDPVPPDCEAAEARRQSKEVSFHYNWILPDELVGAGYSGKAERFRQITDKDRQQVAAHVQRAVQRMKDFGLDYADWYGEPWEEAGDASAEAALVASQLVKAADPKVQFYVNPAFPQQIENFRKMSRAADCFSPFWVNWFNGPEWRAEIKPGRVNALYGIMGSNRSELHEELVGHYRILPWHAFKLGLNGWAFYAYYGPRGDPYTDYEPAGSETDYSVVYPGPLGPVPSRQAEAYRDGWEDYRLLTLLAASTDPAVKEALAQACAAIPDGREPLTGTGIAAPVDFETLRLRLLRLAAQRK